MHLLMTKKTDNDEVPPSPSIEIISGKFGPEDEVILWHGRMPTLLEIGQIVAHVLQNDERIWPRSEGYDGGERWRNYLIETLFRGKVTFAMCKKYGLRIPRNPSFFS